MHDMEAEVGGRKRSTTYELQNMFRIYAGTNDSNLASWYEIQGKTHLPHPETNDMLQQTMPKNLR